jgi:hypothetical protein
MGRSGRTDAGPTWTKGATAMDFGGFNWSLLTIIGPIVLLLVIAWALLRNRRSRERDEDTEAGTRRVYEEEEREHHGESDNVP